MNKVYEQILTKRKYRKVSNKSHRADRYDNRIEKYNTEIQHQNR